MICSKCFRYINATGPDDFSYVPGFPLCEDCFFEVDSFLEEYKIECLERSDDDESI